MNLDKLAIKASIRSGNQAIDLGYLLARKWWLDLTLASFLPALCILIPLSFAFSHSPLWALFIVWWLKPVWERLPLFYASRKIFNETITLKDISSNFKLIFLNQIVPNLLWRRFSFQRAFDAPVSLLENLSSKDRVKRIALLHGKYSDAAINNQFFIAMLESVVSVAIFFAVISFIPEKIGFQLVDSSDALTLSAQWIYCLSAFLAMVLAMPFHCMAGFSLYLNRRIDLEAWDIEITFKQIANKRNKALGHNLLMVGLVLFSVIMINPSESLAQNDLTMKSSKQLIQQVLKEKDFGTERKVEKWRFKQVETSNTSELYPEWMITLLRYLEEYFSHSNKKDKASDDTRWNITDWAKMLLISASIMLLFYFLYRYRVPITHWRKKSIKTTETPPEVMFGLDVTAQSLPDHVTVEVLRLWQEHAQRDALALLYRATISRLIEGKKFEFKASDTELECAQTVKASNESELSDFFTSLTRQWRHLAYGHELPTLNQLEQLCKQWDLQIDRLKRDEN